MFIFYKQIASLAAAFPSFAQTEQKCCCRTQGSRRLPHKSMKDLSNWEICSLWPRLTQCSLGLHKVIFTFEKEKTVSSPLPGQQCVTADKFPVRCLDMKVPIGNRIVSKSRDNFHFLKEMKVKSGKPK